MIKNTTLTAIYDGVKQVEIKCKINTETKEVFDIKLHDIVKNFDYFQGFYLRIGEMFVPVIQKNEAKESDYWYK